MAGRGATYWSCGGDILAIPRHVLSDDDILALHGLHLDEAKAAADANNTFVFEHAQRLALELTTAAAAAMRWRRASGVLAAFRKMA